jgi:hypothetical protein
MNGVETLPLGALLAAIRAECLGSWPGATGERRADGVRALLDRVLPEYASALGLTQQAVLQAIEQRRDYSAVNYYQEGNFPPLDGVLLFGTVAKFKHMFPSGRYRCPACDGVSSDPYACNAGTVRDGEACDWKAYGLFRTLGKGLRVIITDNFLTCPVVQDIFMPVERAGGGAA